MRDRNEADAFRPLTLEEQKAVDKQPKNPFHPGEMLLEEFLEPMRVSQAAFAQKSAGAERV